MRLDKMTQEQRNRFEAHCADQKANHKFSPPIVCTGCDKVILDFNAAGGWTQRSDDAVVIPFFGCFCSQACASAFERDYGILFKRDATGRVSYE